MVAELSPEAVRAFRLRAHNLTERLNADGLLAAAGQCAVQDSPPGSALLALHARVADLTARQVDAAISEQRTLVRTWAMRGAPFCFPVADAAVFTTGALPPTAAAMGQLVVGIRYALQQLDLELLETVELVERHLPEVLSGRQLEINALGAELAAHIAADLPPTAATTWGQPGPYAPGQPLGEAVVHFCLRILTLRGVVCFAPRTGNQAPLVLVEQWLGHPFPQVEPQVARAELLRRFLRCYGPATPAGFAAWLGVRVGDTEPWWRLLAGELDPVDFGARCWVRSEDLPALYAAQPPTGVRLLPPRDPYTQMPDRDTIVAGKHQRGIWRAVGEPGTVLVSGEIVGTWRPRKAGPRLTVSIRPFKPITGPDRELLAHEADQIAILRGAKAANLQLEGSAPAEHPQTDSRPTAD